MAELPEPVGGIAFDPRGRITIELDDDPAAPVVTLRRPKYGQVKMLLLAWDDAVVDHNAALAAGRADLEAEGERVAALPTKTKAQQATAEDDQARYAARVDAFGDEWNERLRDLRANWWRLVAKTIADPSGPQLPDDVDDWPAALLYVGDLPNRAGQLWKHFP